MIEIGKSYTIEQVVTPEMTARAIGSGGLEVFGTPFMMAMMEHAAMDCVQPDLPEGKGTVGVDIQSSHLAPTPAGMTVRATATVTGVSENGKLITFRVEASDGWGPIGEGTHTRAIIANDRFLQKCNSKLTERKYPPAASKEGGERRSPPSFCNARKKSCPAPSKALAIRGREPYNISSV